MKKNKLIKEKLSKKVYENIIKIKNIKNKNDEIINKILNENEKNKIIYENEMLKLKKDIKALSNIKENNIKLKEELKKYLPNNQNIIKNNLNKNENKTNKNIIKDLLDIKLKENNNNIILFNSFIKDGIDVFLNNKKINMIQDMSGKLIINLKKMVFTNFKLFLIF